jgi:hypothetical protein
MKEVMPSNYRMMKKRRNELRQSQANGGSILSATMDSTLRMPGNIPRGGFGIRNLDPKNLKEQTLQISSYKDFERGRGAIKDLE